MKLGQHFLKKKKKPAIIHVKLIYSTISFHGLFKKSWNEIHVEGFFVFKFIYRFTCITIEHEIIRTC